MQTIIDQIEQQIKKIPFGTKEEIRVKSAFRDCLVLVKSFYDTNYKPEMEKKKTELEKMKKDLEDARKEIDIACRHIGKNDREKANSLITLRNIVLKQRENINQTKLKLTNCIGIYDELKKNDRIYRGEIIDRNTVEELDNIMKVIKQCAK